MTNNITFELESKEEKEVIIKVDNKIKKKISLKNKSINTKEIYNMLNYKKDNNYVLNGSKFSEEDTEGKANETKRLFNYIYDLLSDILKAINDIEK